MKKCQECNKVKKSVHKSIKYGIYLCDNCRVTYRKHPVIYIPPNGEIHYDNEGRVICHECGRSYHKLTTHILTMHKMTASEYKEKFELNRTCRLTSKHLQEKFKNNPNVDILTVRKGFEVGHKISAKPRRLQMKKNRQQKIRG